MKMTTHIKHLIVALVVALTATSCLDKEPGSAIPTDEAMQSFNDAEQTVTGIYALMKSSALWSGYLTLLPDVQTDLVYAVEGYSNAMGQFWQWNIRPTTSEVESVYAALYGIIANCNLYLERIDSVMSKQTDDDSITTLEQYTGEVYAIRALCYSELLKLYCKAYNPATAESDLGVVLRKSFSKPEPARRASMKESYDFVVKDLQQAEEILARIEELYSKQGNLTLYSSYYMTSYVAHALHARVALYMQDWQSAIEHSTEVIESKYYRLSAANEAYTSTMSYFDYMWTNDVATETIWQVGFTQTSYGGALGQSFLNFTTDYQYYYPDYVPAQWVLDLYSGSDLRYDSYFATLPTGYAHGLSWPLLVKYYGNQNFINNGFIYHVSMPKPFRLAEQYLIRAEAYCRSTTPNYSLASKDLVALRSTRFVSGGGISLTADNCIEQIAEERVRELYMEGHRLQDIKRWGDLYRGGEGFTRTPQANSLEEGSSLSVRADHPLFVWPIPQHEIEAPGSEVEQNKL